MNINKNSFYPKNYFNNKNHVLNNDNNNNNNQMNNKNNYFNYDNNTNTKAFNEQQYYFNNNNNFNYPNLVNTNGWRYNKEDNIYYFEPQDENNSSNFYYTINRFQDNFPIRNFYQQK